MKTEFKFFEVLDILVDMLYDYTDFMNEEKDKKKANFEESALINYIYDYLHDKKYIGEYKKMSDNTDDFVYTTTKGRVNWENRTLLGEACWEVMFSNKLNKNETKVIDADSIRILRELIVEKEDINEIMEEYSTSLVQEIQDFYAEKRANKISDNEVINQWIKQYLDRQVVLKIDTEFWNTILNLTDAVLENEKTYVEHLDYIIDEYTAHDFLYHVKNLTSNSDLFERYSKEYKKSFSIYIPIGDSQEFYEWNSCFEDLILFQDETPYLYAFSNEKDVFNDSYYREKIELETIDFGTNNIEYIVAKEVDETYRRAVLLGL